MDDELNENGKLACMMAATLAAGVMSNPAYNREPLKPNDMMQMAAEMIGVAMSSPELRKTP